MKTNIKLTDFLNISSFENYKVHLACSNGEYEPLDLFYNDYESWIGWNEYYGEKNDFNRDFILSLIKDYTHEDTYIFAGIFKVIERRYGERYIIEEITDYEQYKGNLIIPFKRYQGLRGRSFKLETLADSLIVSEILFQDKSYHKIENNAPNIFDYATSELSQDAMITWLMNWANDSYSSTDKELCELGKKFVSMLTGMDADTIHYVEAGRQWKNIDIWATINDDAFLIIEDKTETSVHDNQLERYKSIVEAEYDGERTQLYYAYIKTTNEPSSTLSEITGLGYKAFNRGHLLSLLKDYIGKNAIVTDYRNHLQELENLTLSYQTLPVDEWGWYSWHGFYSELEQYIDVESWSYVANPNGGFLGLWWNFISNDEINMYLQFEESKLCIKIEYDGDEDRASIRWKYYSKLMDCAKQANINVVKPVRFGNGTYMTIAIVPKEEIFGTNPINMSLLVEKLKKLEKLIKTCIESE